MFNLETLYIALSKNLHYVYLLFAIPLVYFSVAQIPPFQNPDEPNHFARAEQVSRFELIPHFVYVKDSSDTAQSPAYMAIPAGGFLVDKGVFQTADLFAPIAHNIGTKVTSADFDSVKNIKWGTSAILKNFANTAIYSPIGYVMSALGIITGKLVNLSVMKTFYLARALNSILALTLCFLALRLANRSKILLFTVLLFPMTITLFASVSQDAVLISCAFLLIGIIDNTESNAGKNYSKTQKTIMILLMSVVAIAKPPYLPLVLVFPFLKLDRKAKIISIIIPCVLVTAWLFAASANFAIRMPETDLSYNPTLQLAYMMAHPFKFISLFFKLDGGKMLGTYKMFIGVLGWLDTAFPHNYYLITYLASLLAVAINVNTKLRDKITARAGLLLAAFITLAAILTTQYINFTAVAAPYLGGLQGRYLIPIFPFFAMALCLSSQEQQSTNFKMVVFMLILLFPIITAVNLVAIVNLRYYPQ